jgi:predicted ATPase
VEGFRSLVNVTLPLRSLTVMIGPNGSGKTSVLEVFRLLKEASEERLAAALERMGGPSAVLSRTPSRPNRLKLALTADAESSRNRQPLHYRFELIPRGISYVILSEQLEQQVEPQAGRSHRYIDAHDEQIFYADLTMPGAAIQPTWPYNHLELALAQMPRVYQEPEALRSALSRTRAFRPLDVSYRSAVRLPQALTPTTSPGPNGETLYAALYNLRTLHFDVYGRIEEVLQLAFPGFQRLEFPVVGAGQVTMAWYQSDLTSPLYPNELYEGTLYFLWLATILLAPDPAPLTLIDEPEVSLHPELLQLLAGLLQDAAMRGQIIVATHSSDLIRWLQPDEVVVLDKVEGATNVTWADSLNLTEWLKEYTLSDLWLMGTLGGRS